MLDVRRLRVLGEVARQGSFSGAADALYLSQSAVSQQVAALEREVGMTLLERTSDGPKLTDAGRVLLDHADAAIARLDEAEHELAAIAGLEGGELRMASFPSASVTVLTAALSEFRTGHPKVRLRVIDAEPEESLQKLKAADIDIAIVFDYPLLAGPQERDVERVPLLTESMYLALPRKHPLAKKSKVRLTDLADDAWLCGVRPSSCGELIVQACREAGFEPDIAFESEEYEVLQGYVAAGLGFTLLPDLAVANLRSDLVIRPTDPAAPQRRVWAAVRSRGARSAAADAMLDTLVDVAKRFEVDRAAAVAA